MHIARGIFIFAHKSIFLNGNHSKQHLWNSLLYQPESTAQLHLKM